MVNAANANVAASATVNVKETDAPKVNTPKVNNAKKNNNATRKNNAKNAVKNISAKFNSITKNLKKIKGLRESYKGAKNEDKKTKIKSEFETTKIDVVTTQTDINKALLEMALEKNVISYFRNTYPDYLQVLSNLKIVDDAGEIKKIAEENANALNSGNLTGLYGNIKNENLGDKPKLNVANIAPPVSAENNEKLEKFLGKKKNANNKKEEKNENALNSGNLSKLFGNNNTNANAKKNNNTRKLPANRGERVKAMLAKKTRKNRKN